MQPKVRSYDVYVVGHLPDHRPQVITASLEFGRRKKPNRGTDKITGQRGRNAGVHFRFRLNPFFTFLSPDQEGEGVGTSAL